MENSTSAMCAIALASFFYCKLMQYRRHYRRVRQLNSSILIHTVYYTEYVRTYIILYEPVTGLTKNASAEQYGLSSAVRPPCTSTSCAATTAVAVLVQLSPLLLPSLLQSSPYRVSPTEDSGDCCCCCCRNSRPNGMSTAHAA